MKRWKNRRDWPGKSVMMLGILMMTLGACGSVNSERYFETEIHTSQCMDEKAEIQWDGLHTYAEPAMEQTRICVQTIQGENLLILPSAMSPSAVTFWLEDAASAKLWVQGTAGSESFTNGEAVDLTKICAEKDYTLRFRSDDSMEDYEYELRIVFSGSVSTLYLVSDDPINLGREWVEDSGHKRHEATGKMVMQKADGSILFNGILSQVKGRGNSTWQCEKKPYQIKMASKVDLLETGDDANNARTWTLLSNYYDNTLLRNVLTLNMGNALGMEFNMDSTWVDLYYDGEYRGNYLLTEKVQIGSGRLELVDLEEKNEDRNPNIESLPIKSGITENGATYTYCENMTTPKDITGGYLLEFDYKV